MGNRALGESSLIREDRARGTVQQGLENVNRLRKYVEWMSRGHRTNRIVYVMKEWDLPVPLAGAEWQPDSKFSVADELLANPDLKAVFKEALEKGVALWFEPAFRQERLQRCTVVFNNQRDG
jgi:hypothetical protein